MPCWWCNRSTSTSQAAAENERWLPLFWGLDYFKQAQAQDVREGDWTMPPVDEAKLPEPATGLRRVSPGDGPLG